MNTTSWLALSLYVLHLTLQIVFIARALLRPHREPASRIAWEMVIMALPILGVLAYILFGEVDIGRRRVARLRAAMAQMPEPSAAVADTPAEIPERYTSLFRVGHSISGFDPVGGNRATLLPNSNATIDAMVADIDAAKEHVHLLFYIWLPDNNGCKMIEALKRAAARGVTCRAMVDDLGSRILIRSKHWQDMAQAGVRLARALPIGNPLLRILRGRIDLRDHRKIVVIDHRITYCGSQNCADPEFRIKAKYAPWVDAVMRFEGPIARQNQYLFVGDWMAQVNEDIGALVRQSITPFPSGLSAQVIGTGPTVRFSAMPEMFESLMYAAQRELTISTPYFVPNESLQAALCASACRGVVTTLIVPARNDSWIVRAASRSYYGSLLAAGVRLFEYQGGLLHTKSMTLDGEVTLIGSANLDRRSFDLNYENNILFYDPALTAEMRQRQQQYIASSRTVTAEAVANWTWRQQIWNNAVAILGPVL